MQLNQCSRCGSFFATESNVCPNCEAKDKNEISKLKTFLTESDDNISLEEISCNTGISIKNLDRFLSTNNFSSLSKKISLNDKGNISINL